MVTARLVELNQLFNSMQSFVEGSGYVQLLSDVTLTDLDHQESAYLTQATVCSPHTSCLCVNVCIYSCNETTCCRNE